MNDAETERLKKCLDTIEAWEFNVFELKEASFNNELCILVNYLFKRYNFLPTFGLDRDRFRAFVHKIQGGYLPTNTYHNATHAADVTHATSYLLNQAMLFQIAKLTDLDAMACIVAAMIHDYEHP